jgi:hypothetical protein
VRLSTALVRTEEVRGGVRLSIALARTEEV